MRGLFTILVHFYEASIINQALNLKLDYTKDYTKDEKTNNVVILVEMEGLQGSQIVTKQAEKKKEMDNSSVQKASIGKFGL